MSRWVSENPQAGLEIDGLQDLCQRLQSTAPVAVDLLHPHQRAAVITGPQKVRKMVAAAAIQAPRRRPSFFVPIAYGFSRVAAAAVLIIGGYLAGTHMANQQTGGFASTKPLPPVTPATKPDTTSEPTLVQPFKAKEVPMVAPAPVEPPAARPLQAADR